MDLKRLNVAKFLKTGDREAFQFLYLAGAKQFRRYADKLTGERYAEDLVQLTCLKVLQYDGRMKDPATFNFENFFCRSMHNVFIDQCRRKEKTWELPGDFMLTDHPYSERSLAPLISHIEKHLNPAQKQVMYLRMKGVKYKHIAAIMGVNINTARGVFRYGQHTLKKYCKEILEI